MKKFKTTLLLFCFFNLLVCSAAFSANELFRSISSGNWNSTSTWEMSTNGGGVWFAATSTPRDTSGTITIRNPNTVTVTVSTTANQMVIDSGGVLTINTGIILTVPDGSGDDIIASKGSIINGPGNVRTQGASVFINLRAGSAFNANLTVNTGTTIANDGGSPFVGSLFGNVTVDAGATLNGGNISGRQLYFYGNVTNNGTLTTTSSGGILRIKGPSLINNGSIPVAGSFYLDSTTSISGNGTFTPSSTFIKGNISLLNNITYSPTSQITIENGGVLNPNGNVFTLTSGTMSLDVGATVSASGAIKTQGSVIIFLVPGSAFNASLNVNTGTTVAYHNSGGKLFGNVTVDAGATLNGGNISGRQLYFYGNVTNNGTLTTTSSGGILRIKGSSLINNGSIPVAGSFYLDSTTSISGNGTFTPASTFIKGNISLLSNITYSPTSQITIENGGVLNPNGNVFTLTSGTMSLDVGAAISVSGTVKTQGSVIIFLVPGSSFNAALNVNNGTTIAYHNSGGKLFGNVTIDAGATLNGGNILGRQLYFYGNVTNNGTLTASSSGGIIRIKGSSLINNGTIGLTSSNFFFDTTTSLSGTGSFTSHANLTGNANVTLNSTHQMSSFTINTGTVFNISNQLLKLTASNPITQNGTFTTTNSKIEYNGTALQTVSATNINYYGLRINNAAGATLPANITVNDTLSVILGGLNLNTRIITLPATGHLTETPGNVVFGTTGSIVTTRNINAPSSLNVAGLGAVLTTSSNLGSTEVRRGHTVQTGLLGGTSIKRYYDITPVNNTGLNATLTFKYDDSELNMKPEALLRLYKSTNTGTNWTLQGGFSNVVNNEITLTGINSFSRWSADSSGASAVISLIMEAFYETGINKLNMRDTIRAYFRNTVFPYTVVDSSKAILDSATFTAAYRFVNAPSGTYFIQLKHRNSIETWSMTGRTYTAGSTLNYDFTTAANQAFGSNMIQRGTKYCIYSGDVNQDGDIDVVDMINIYNDFGNSGYLSADVNGDDYVDVTDLIFSYNNATNVVTVIRP